jgi:uncharacterized protein (DUF58 family)
MTDHLARARSLTRIPAHRRVTSLLEGEYVALHPGRSTEFTDLREYVPGDDPKDLDWKASARARTLLVRRYHALRKLTLHLEVSTGRGMTAASPAMVPRHDVALAVAGVLGHLAVRHGDLVGMVHGDGAHQTVIPPRGGAAHAERCLRSAAEAAAGATGPSDLGALLRRVVRSVRRRATLVVVADVVAVDESVLSALRRLSVRRRSRPSGAALAARRRGPASGAGRARRRGPGPARGRAGPDASRARPRVRPRRRCAAGPPAPGEAPS